MKPAFVSLIALMALDVSTAPLRAVDEVKPNIIFFLADDLGFMDIRANNPRTFYETLNIELYNLHDDPGEHTILPQRIRRRSGTWRPGWMPGVSRSKL
jgi:hypothetical protein